MMKSFIILNILVFVYVGGQSSPRPPNWGEAGECCRRKVVGGITYRLVERSNLAFTYPYYCSTNCVYMTEGSDVKYCFRPGGLESECFDEGGSNHNMTGGSTGSPTGSPGGKCRECLFVECEQYDHDYPIP